MEDDRVTVTLPPVGNTLLGAALEHPLVALPARELRLGPDWGLGLGGVVAVLLVGEVQAVQVSVTLNITPDSPHREISIPTFQVL